MTETTSSFLQYIGRVTMDEDIPAWSGYMPEKKLSNDNSRLFFDLPVVARALMIADGTVTMALEVVFKEPIKVNLLDQYMLQVDTEVPLLGIDVGSEAFYREVELVGEFSGKQYVRAYSLLKRDALSDELWQKLKDREVGMGVVLRNAAQGSFRKVLHMGIGDLQGNDEDYSHRTYSVNIENKPAILITEVFSLEALIKN